MALPGAPTVSRQDLLSVVRLVAGLPVVSLRWSGGAQGAGQAEVGEDAVVEPGQGADPGPSEGDDEQPVGVGDGRVALGQVQPERGLSGVLTPTAPQSGRCRPITARCGVCTLDSREFEGEEDP